MPTLPDWIVLVPPLLVIISVLTTRRMIFSFLLGIITSALIVKGGNILQAAQLTFKHLWTSTGLGKATSIEGFLSSWSLLIFIFLICLGILIVFLSESGAANAYVQLVRKKVHSKKEAESASLILSLFFFIDDYFSALTVGSVMKPLALLHNVHPVKLAFLTTAMATPLTLLSPISSWVGEIVLQLKNVGIGPESPTTVIATDPYSVLVSAIPYLLYPILLVLGTWYIVLRGISYGPMQKYDNYISPTHETAADVGPKLQQTASLIDFILPLVVLVGTVFGMLLYTGNYHLMGGTNSLFMALKTATVHIALFTGGITSLVFSIVYFYTKGTVPAHKIAPSMRTGFMLMFPSIIMLVCAWSLGAILKNDLETGSYIATMVASIINVEYFPLICFIFGALIAWMIGSAWATIGLMFPIVIDMLQELLNLGTNVPLHSVELIIPLIGATLSGAVLGVHLSVLSDNPIMSAASTGANHLEHVKTMAWYVIPIGLVSALGFTFIGLMIDNLGHGMSLGIGIIGCTVLTVVVLELCQYLFSKPQT